MWREICTCCGRINHVGFTVPNVIWNEAVPAFFINSILCLQCFATFADESLIEWDKDIEFWPVSLKRHLDLNQEEDKEPDGFGTGRIGNPRLRLKNDGR